MKRPALVLILCSIGLPSAATAADSPAGAVLHLADGSFVAGELRGSADPNVIGWRSPAFAEPLLFPLSGVHAVQYPVAGAPPAPKGGYCFELIGGDVMYGDLLGVSGSVLELDSARLGRVHLRRDSIVRFYRWHGSDTLYLGPNGLTGWEGKPGTAKWRDEGGMLATDAPGSSVFADLAIPDRALIEAELSWKRKPNFMFVLGDDRRRTGRPRSFRLEVWDDDLVMVGESARTADLVALQKVGSGEGRIRFQAYLDRKEGRLTLLRGSGEPWAKLDVKSGDELPRSGLSLTNLAGDIRLERLRIVSWNAQLPGSAQKDQPRVRRTDGSIVYGELIAFDPKARQFSVREGARNLVVEQDAVAEVYCGVPSMERKATPDPKAPAASRLVRLVYLDGSCFSGKPTRIEDKLLSLACPSIQEELRLPLTHLRAFTVLPKSADPPAPMVAGRPGRLEADGLNLKGRLVAGSDRPNSSCLRWHSDMALNAGSLLHGMSGRIVFREPRPPIPEEVRARNQGQRQDKWFESVFGREPPADAAPPSEAVAKCMLHLRSGDTIPCEVNGIDETGVRLKTPLSDATFVAHDQIKSVSLIESASSPILDATKRDRLLTLPRLQKDSPPTHLICSQNGDFLRGRVVELNEKKLKVEVRMEVREIPRNRVAQIIWLRADEGKEPKAFEPGPDPGRLIRLQAVRADGNRLTFTGDKGDGQTIAGKSEVLGACRAELKDLDQLLIGTAIELSAARLVNGAWKLHNAQEPKFAQAGPGGAADSQMTGVESPLIGQPAPAISLDTLEGRRFDLNQHKGRVVVVDFWATWCGPCMQSLPLVEAMIREFPNRGVTFIAVNLEEQPELIRSVLERRKLPIPVALDRDGVAAARYTVTAIPQTVVVDRDGKVARVFVGGGKDMPDGLRKAIRELTTSKDSGTASSPKP